MCHKSAFEDVCFQSHIATQSLLWIFACSSLDFFLEYKDFLMKDEKKSLMVILAPTVFCKLGTTPVISLCFSVVLQKLLFLQGTYVVRNLNFYRCTIPPWKQGRKSTTENFVYRLILTRVDPRKRDANRCERKFSSLCKQTNDSWFWVIKIALMIFITL